MNGVTDQFTMKESYYGFIKDRQYEWENTTVKITANIVTYSQRDSKKKDAPISHYSTFLLNISQKVI